MSAPGASEIRSPLMASATWPSSDTQTATRQVSSTMSTDTGYIGATRQVPQTIFTGSNPDLNRIVLPPEHLDEVVTFGR